MIRVAFDTSTRVGSVAIGEQGGVLAERTVDPRATHTETVLPALVALLADAGRRPAEVAEVVVGAGPGSFTGVRIAASLAKGLRFAREARLHAYSSLLCVAAGSGLERNVCALFDARRGEVYTEAYRRVFPPEPELEPQALSVAELLKRLDPARWIFVGEGAILHREAIAARGGDVLAEDVAYPRAATLLRLRARCPEAGLVADPAAWEPAYARRSGAVRARERIARGGG